LSDKLNPTSDVKDYSKVQMRSLDAVDIGVFAMYLSGLRVVCYAGFSSQIFFRTSKKNLGGKELKLSFAQVGWIVPVYDLRGS
jgi:hypothetical protein